MDEEAKKRFAPRDHRVISERQSIINAMQGIDLDDNGNIANYEEAVDNLMALNNWDGADSDEAMILTRAALKRNDWDAARSLMARYEESKSKAGQALQATKKWIKETPEDRLIGIIRAVNRMAQNHKARKGMEIKISDELLTEYKNAQTEQERDEVITKMQKQVADTIKPTLMDKWTALRYVNMLGNFKTQGRNLIGNATMKTVYWAENEIAALSEVIANAASGGKLGRTKSAAVGREWMRAAKADYANVKNEILSGGKYNDRSYEDDFTEAVEDKRRIFGKYNPMEYYRKGTNLAMEAGDAMFCKSAYARALAGYLKANGTSAMQLDAGTIDEALLAKAREYAIKRAQEQTFRDSNAFSNWAVRALRRNDTPKALKVMGEGLAPFRKTPANVMARAVEFSPLGVVNTAVKAAQVAKGKEDVTGADVVDALSKTVTGSLLFGLGWVLSDMGLLHGGADEDDEAIDELMNEQQWSLELPGGGSYTLDWAAPASLIMFTGANMQELASDEGLSLKDFESALTSLAEPMIQMSMLSGINDTLDSIKYSDNNLIQMASNLAVGYLTQGLTNTLLGQFERTFEDTRMSTYVDSEDDMPDWLQRTVGKASAKTPIAEYNQREYLDEFGNTENSGPVWQRVLENFFSPGYFEAGNEGKPAYDFAKWAHDNLGVDAFPDPYVNGSMSYDGEKLTLTQAEKDRYQTTRGSAAESYLEAAAESEWFTKNTEDGQRGVLERLMTMANGLAKSELLDGRDIEEEDISETTLAIRELTPEQMVAYYSYDVAFDKLTGSKELNKADAESFDQQLKVFGELDEAVQNILLEDNTFAKAYEAYGAGMSSMTFLEIKSAVKAAKVPEGYVNQPNWHKNEVIMDMDISEADKLTAIKQNHADSSIAEKIQTAYDNDIPLAEIVAYYALTCEKDEDGKSLGKIERRITARDRGISNFEELERIFK